MTVDFQFFQLGLNPFLALLGDGICTCLYCRTVKLLRFCFVLFFNEDFLQMYKCNWFREKITCTISFMFLRVSSLPKCKDEKGWVTNPSMRSPLWSVIVTLFTDLGCKSDAWRFPMEGMRRIGQIYRGICKLWDSWWFCELDAKHCVGSELLCSSGGYCALWLSAETSGGIARCGELE